MSVGLDDITAGALKPVHIAWTEAVSGFWTMGPGEGMLGGVAVSNGELAHPTTSVNFKESLIGRTPTSVTYSSITGSDSLWGGTTKDILHSGNFSSNAGVYGDTATYAGL